MTSDAPHTGGPVRPAVALMLAVVGFFALLIFGLGMTSLLTGSDVVGVPGLGQLPGVFATALATAVFAAGLWLTIRSSPDRVPNPSFWAVAWIAPAVLLGYLAGLGVTAVATGADLAGAAAAVGTVATSWFAVVIAGAAAVAGWAGIALVRTRAQRPRWPWEDDDEL